MSAKKNNFLFSRFFGISISAFLYALIFNVFSVALAQDNCKSELAKADSNYSVGHPDEAIKLLNRCLDKGSLTQTDSIEVYKLLGLAHFAKDDTVQAKSAIWILLKLWPAYDPYPPQVPPPFKTLVDALKQEMGMGERLVEPAPEVRKPNVGKWLKIGGGILVAGVVSAYFILRNGNDGNGFPPPEGRPPK